MKEIKLDIPKLCELAIKHGQITMPAQTKAMRDALMKQLVATLPKEVTATSYESLETYEDAVSLKVKTKPVFSVVLKSMVKPKPVQSAPVKTGVQIIRPK